MMGFRIASNQDKAQGNGSRDSKHPQIQQNISRNRLQQNYQ